jgi:rSAM/selenodomain-associated transferase 1
MRVPLAVFVRPPHPGKTKTRLVPALGDQGAVDLYRAFVQDTIQTVLAADCFDITVWVAGDPEDPSLEGLVADLPRRAQSKGDLGVRMAQTLETHIAHAGRGLIIGSDAPTLPESVLRAGLDALDRHDLVLGPSADGGYYLIGARGRVPRVFEGIAWSTPSVLTETLSRARSAGLTVALLPPFYDVDTPDDLRLLRTHLTLDPSAAPVTATHLSDKRKPK